MRRLVIVDGERESPAGDLPATFPRRYCDFIAALSRANASLEWWALTLAGRNPLSSPLPRRIFELLLAVERARAVPDAELRVPARDWVIARQMERWGRENGFSVENRVPVRMSLKDRLNSVLPGGPAFGFLRALLRMLAVRRKVRFRQDPGGRHWVLATLLNHQSFDSKGAYRDAYFGDLPRFLKESGVRPLVFGSITHHFFRTLDRSVDQSRETGIPILPMEAFLGPVDLLSIFLKAMRLRLFGFPWKGEARFEGLDVGVLLAEEIRANLAESRFFHDLWYHACSMGLARSARVERVFFPFENRCWERMLTLAFRELAPKAEIIGYQHAVITPFHLNFLLGRGEAEILPLPDRILTMGPAFVDRMRAGGFPERILGKGCALRQAPAALARRPAGRRVLVALASSVDEYARVLKLLDQALAVAKSGFLVRIRPHPVIPLEAALERARPSFAFDRDPAPSMEESLDWADILVFASGTLGLESLRRGIPTLFLEVGSFLSTDPLEGFAGIKRSARTPGELLSALEELSSLTPERLAALRREGASGAGRLCSEADGPGLAAFLR
jgi:surface carbohydrate biosynthesis protein (TIGR04326 family)